MTDQHPHGTWSAEDELMLGCYRAGTQIIDGFDTWMEDTVTAIAEAATLAGDAKVNARSMLLEIVDILEIAATAIRCTLEETQ